MNSSHKQILVIEDHECVRVLLGGWLKKQNYQVTTKADGETQSEIEQCIDLGARGFLKKPFNPTNLNDKIGSILFPPINNQVNLA